MYKKQWQQEQYLNKGSYAEVFRVRMQGKDYALKKIYPKYLKNQNDRQIVQRQIMIMSKMDHPRIIKMHKAFVQEQEISLLLQFASGGSLHDQLRMYKKLPEHQVKRYVKDIVSALEYLHSRESPILHRDIKPENLLIDSEGNCKLADFGSANILDGQRRSYVGTRQYMAPQMQDEKPHGIEIDIWTLGVLIYQLLTGQVPSSRYYFPSHLSRPAEDVIKKLMNKDQSKRMSLQELKEHIWLYEQFNITPTIGENTAKSKIQIMRQKIKERINNREMKTQFFNLPLPKQKSVLQENQDINRQVKRYISLLMERDELKYKVLQNQKKIEQQQSRRMAQRPFLLQEIDRLKKQIKQYQSNIQILRNKPLKMEAQCRQIIQTLKKKIDELKEYIKSLPQRTKSQLLHFSSYEAHDEALPISDYIFTLRLQIMTSRRDALIELRAAKKIYLDIMEMTQVQDSLNTFEEKYEQSFEPTLTSLKQKML